MQPLLSPSSTFREAKKSSSVIWFDIVFNFVLCTLIFWHTTVISTITTIFLQLLFLKFFFYDISFCCSICHLVLLNYKKYFHLQRNIFFSLFLKKLLLKIAFAQNLTIVLLLLLIFKFDVFTHLTFIWSNKTPEKDVKYAQS